MIIDQTNYLAFGKILIFEVIGSVELTIALGLLVIAFFGIKMKLDIKGIIAICLLWIMFIMVYAYNSFLLALVLLVVVIIIYLLMHKIWKDR